MEQFFEQFVLDGVDPAIFWWAVIVVVLFVLGMTLIVVGRMGDPQARTTLSPLDHPQRAKRVVPGLRIQREWQRYLREYQARGGLGSILVQPPDEFGGDAFLRDTPQAPASDPPPVPAPPALREQAHTRPPPASSVPRPAPVTAERSSPPLPSLPLFSVTSAPAMAPRPARPGPLAVQPGEPSWPASAPRWGEEAASASALEAEAEGAERNEEDATGGWESGRPWVMLPSRFPIVRSAEEPPTAGALPPLEPPLVQTTFPSRFGREPAQPAAQAAEADASRGALPSHEATLGEETTIPSPVWGEAPLVVASEPALASAPEAEDASTLPPFLAREMKAADLAREEAAAASPAPSTVLSAEPEPLLLTGAPGSPASAETVLLEIRAFGEAHLRVQGEVVPMRKATKELELILFLAQKAAPHQAQGKEIPYLYRTTLADALWPLQGEEGLQRNSLNNAKRNLNRRLQALDPTLAEEVWVELGHGQAALRLAKSVATDLAAFLRLTGALAQAARSAEQSHLPVQEVEDWLSQLHQLYQGDFGLQFRDEEWAQSARAGYRQQYLDALFDVACLLAHVGRRRRAILLAKDLVLEEEVSADPMLPIVLDWLEQEGGKGEVAQWREEYRRRYAYKYQRSLAEDRPEQEALFLRALANGR